MVATWQQKKKVNASPTTGSSSHPRGRPSTNLTATARETKSPIGYQKCPCRISYLRTETSYICLFILSSDAVSRSKDSVSGPLRRAMANSANGCGVAAVMGGEEMKEDRMVAVHSRVRRIQREEEEIKDSAPPRQSLRSFSRRLSPSPLGCRIGRAISSGAASVRPVP